MNGQQRIADDVELGDGVRLSGFLNLYGCKIGSDTTIGAFVEIQRGASIGSRCKISSHTFVCEGVTIEDDCFIGHGVTFINDRRPRAVTDEGEVKGPGDFDLEQTIVRRGASVGSGSTILGGIEIGEHAMVGAGAVVTRSVPPRVTVVGNPARVVHEPSLSRDAEEPPSGTETIPFTDVAGQYRETRDEILAAWTHILDSGSFAGGREVQRFEEAFAEMVGVRYCVGVSSGTDALALALRALEVGPEDAIAIPSNTFAATAEAVYNVGARPILVDCDRDSALMDPTALASIQERQLKGAIPVHLYGLPAPMSDLAQALGDRTKWLLEDAAQAHLARLNGKPAGTIGVGGCFSFYPAKNLGAPGEGGAVVTNDEGLADTVRALRDHGQVSRYRSRYVGWNARMTEMVAVALRIRLPLLPEWTRARQQVASWYRERLQGLPQVDMQTVPPGTESAYHLFVVTVPHRDQVLGDLESAGIGVGLHYPIPIHLQPAFAFLEHAEGDFPNTEWRAARLLSLPMSPTLKEWQVDRVCEELRKSLESRAGT
jgi:dTDP-4-amino-4,6-dideoxygalactose transaminase/acetyltransferase-like isoleucine patch superfamily enzyme